MEGKDERRGEDGVGVKSARVGRGKEGLREKGREREALKSIPWGSPTRKK